MKDHIHAGEYDMVKYLHKFLTIDIDLIEKEQPKPNPKSKDYTLIKKERKKKETNNTWDIEYRLLKALYMYSFIPRIVKETQHGIHVYFPNIPHSLTLRAIYGDDEKRIMRDEWKIRNNLDLHVNILFNSTEKGVKKI